jgi:hypothetical protein
MSAAELGGSDPEFECLGIKEQDNVGGVPQCLHDTDIERDTPIMLNPKIRARASVTHSA